MLLCYVISTPGLMLMVRGSCTVALRGDRFKTPLGDTTEHAVLINHTNLPFVIAVVGSGVIFRAKAMLVYSKMTGCLVAWLVLVFDFAARLLYL